MEGPSQEEQACGDDPTASNANHDAGPRHEQRGNKSGDQRGKDEDCGGGAEQADGANTRNGEIGTADVAEGDSEYKSDGRDETWWKFCVGSYQGAEHKKRKRGKQGELAHQGTGESHESTDEPRGGQEEERDPAGEFAAESGEKSECENRNDLLRRQEEVRDAVIEGTQTGAGKMGLCDCGKSQQVGGEKKRSVNGLSHDTKAIQRKRAPARATKPPEKRRAQRPQSQR